MSKKIAILQPNYIPWKGYFDLISYVDEFILLDDVQYTRRDWRNRNQIITPKGMTWLTIPVKTKGKYLELIKNIEVSNKNWNFDHWNCIKKNYSKAHYYDLISNLLEPLYIYNKSKLLSDINHLFIDRISYFLSISTKISKSSNYNAAGSSTDKLISLTIKAGGDEYVSGPTAKAYIDERKFEDNDIKLTWFNYNDYKEYPQLANDFHHKISIIDLLFNCGNNSRDYLRY